MRLLQELAGCSPSIWTAQALIGATLVASLGDAGPDVVVLETPSICRREPAQSAPQIPLDGRHIVLRFDGPPPDPARGPRLALADVAQFLRADARAAGRDLRVVFAEGPLVVHGEPEALARASELVAELDAAGRRLEVHLEAWFVPATEAAGGAPDDERLAAWRRAGAIAHAATVVSGEAAWFGERVRTPFLATYDVEVAAKSGVAVPISGHVWEGTSLRVRPCRLLGGELIHLDGVLDLATIVGSEEFDPENSDFGRLAQPRLAATLVAFGATLRSGEWTHVAVRGHADGSPAEAIWLRATTTSDPPPPADGVAQLIDLSFVAAAPRELPAWAHESGWEGAFEELRRPASPWPANAVAGLAQSFAREGARSSPLVVGNDVLLVQPTAEDDAQRVRDLLAAATGSRARAGRLAIAYGGLRIDAPLTVDAPLRVQAGSERPLLVGYEVEVAPETWMSAPRVDVSFDGLQLDAAIHEDGDVTCVARELATLSIAVRERRDGNLGRIQEPRRALRSSRARIDAAGERTAVLLEALPERDAPGLSIESTAD